MSKIPDSKLLKADDEESMLRILIVASDFALEQAVAQALAGKYYLLSASGGQDGLEKALALKPALIVTQIKMPGMDGRTMINKLRALDDFNKVPIVLLADADDDVEKLALLENGAQDFVSNSFAHAELRVRVANLLKVKNAELKYQTLMDNMDAGFCILQLVFEADGRACDYIYLDANRAFIEHTGMHDAIGKSMRQMFPEHEQHWYDMYGNVAKNGESIRFEQVAEAMGRWFSVYAFRLGDPADLRVAVFFNDITERKQAQLAAEEHIRRQTGFVSVMENSSDLVGMADATTGMATYINPAGLKMLGIEDGAQVWHRPMTEFVSAENLPKLSRALEVAATAGIWQGELILRNFQTGEPVHLYLRIWTILDENQKRTHFATIATPLPDQKRMAEVLDVLGHQRTINDELREALDDLQGLAQVVSHELQEPLQIIKSYQNLLAVRYKGRLGSDADEFIAKCTEASERTKKMVDDLWEYAQVIRPSFVPERVDSGAALIKAISELQGIIAETNAVIEYGALPEVIANESLLTAVFLRLLDNSIKFRTTLQPPLIRVNAENTHEAWRFSVQDNACGIDPMIARDIFKLFFKGQGRSGPVGSGMGLPVARKIIEYFGGTISFDSAPARGSTFFFTLPHNHYPVK